MADGLFASSCFQLKPIHKGLKRNSIFIPVVEWPNDPVHASQSRRTL